MINKYNIFILMPFEIDLTQIYQQYIKVPLSNLGHSVSRADDISKSTNILDDIVNHIIKSDIIIADLTGKNSNVFYELGRAHQLGKWLIQIAQDQEDLPFDLKLIRTIFYTTDQNGLKKLRDQVIKYIESFKKEKAINSAITNLSNSGSFNESIAIAEYIIGNEPDITKEQLIKIANATQINDQLYNSWKVKDILKPLFSKQKVLLPKIIQEKLERYGWIE